MGIGVGNDCDIRLESDAFQLRAPLPSLPFSTGGVAISPCDILGRARPMLDQRGAELLLAVRWATDATYELSTVMVLGRSTADG